MRVQSRGLLLVLLALLGACAVDADGAADARDDRDEGTDGQIRVTDASGSTLTLAAPPIRILALIPSVNQILVELGARDLLVGRTDYDTLSVLSGLPSVGGGLGANLETMIALEPQLVIGFQGASDARTRDRLKDLGIPHLGVRPDGIEDVRRIIAQMGQVTGRQAEAEAMTQRLDAEIAEVRAAVFGLPVLRAGYLLGGTPPLAAGPGTFLNELLEIAGASNAFDDLTELYAPVSPETVLARQIDVLLLTEGAHVDARLLNERRVVLIPSWVQVPGPDLARAARLVAEALRPDLVIERAAGGSPGEIDP